MRRLLPDGWLPGNACAHAYVGEDRDIAIFSGVRGSNPLTGELEGQGLVQQVARAAANVAALIDAAAIPGRPLVHVRLHVRDHHAYATHIEAVTAILRRALAGRDVSVTVVVAPRLIDPWAAVELDGVVASR
ncbi:MAG: hypothetical protein Kow0010_15830 [Dehalococcoidia bacterium]